MARRSKLSEEQITESLNELSSWTVVENKLSRTFKFANFIEAFAFMTKVAMIAERLDHHPEWFNVYNRVEVMLTTHNAGNTITELDIELARQIDSVG